MVVAVECVVGFVQEKGALAKCTEFSELLGQFDFSAWLGHGSQMCVQACPSIWSSDTSRHSPVEEKDSILQVIFLFQRKEKLELLEKKC